MGRHCHDEDRDSGPNGREHGGHRYGGPHPAPRRCQAAFGQDDDQGRIAGQLGDLEVVEVDTDGVLAQQCTEAEVEQQGRQADPGRQAGGSNRDEEHHRADQSSGLEVPVLHRHILPGHGPVAQPLVMKRPRVARCPC